jgi:hypothetical protein
MSRNFLRHKRTRERQKLAGQLGRGGRMSGMATEWDVKGKESMGLEESGPGGGTAATGIAVSKKKGNEKARGRRRKHPS